MSWVSFICGGMTVLMTYALFNCDQEEGGTIHARGETDLVVNDFSGRYVTLSCQTCRKLKRHKEIQSNLFQCTKCKRQVDIRAS